MNLLFVCILGPLALDELPLFVSSGSQNHDFTSTYYSTVAVSSTSVLDNTRQFIFSRNTKADINSTHGRGEQAQSVPDIGRHSGTIQTPLSRLIQLSCLIFLSIS